ncbi:AAA family ATPase [Miltoncostaea oceani]|uniref:AAA family ATPase n=1 Tax=Miltoncostaea oceani TaxID=2843216 RepID=UPI001C3D3BAD|nr:AAA family ATPase [Miltoncostaea oceani]
MTTAAASVPEIILTGGPCAGKSSALSYLSERLSDWGFRPLVIPEMATFLISNAYPDIARMMETDWPRFIAFQGSLVRMQRAVRAEYLRIAETFHDQRPVILADRAEIDGMAFIGKEQFCEVLAAEGLTLAQIRDSYTAVFHLTTAADGAREHYTLANNTARRESAEQAIEVDRRTLQSWVGHPHLRVIPNGPGGFEAKLAHLAGEIAHTLGVPVPLEIERKFLLSEAPSAFDPVLAQAVTLEIEQIYLEIGAANETRIRRRAQDGAATYSICEKRQISSDSVVREERERLISANEYHALAMSQKPGTVTIRKRRHCFVHNGQYLELDEFLTPRRIWMLEVELTDQAASLDLPESFQIDREVTEDGCFRNSFLARAS